MSKFVIANDPVLEIPTVLYLEQETDGVIIRDDTWYIAKIMNDGRLLLFGSIGSDNYQRDARGHIITTREEDK
jgi:hypothetical protein